MDALTHIFLPLILIYVVDEELFDNPWIYGLVLFAVFPDFDKFLGMPGLFHSLLTLVPLVVLIYLFENRVGRGNKYTLIIAFFLASHLFLDFLGDSLVALLYPVTSTGIGLRYPMEVIFGRGPLGVTLTGSIYVDFEPVNQGFNSYQGLVTGYGIASALLFALIYVRDRF